MSSGIGDTNEMRRRLEQARMAAQRGGIGLDATAAAPPQQSQTSALWQNALALPMELGARQALKLADLYQNPSKLLDMIPGVATLRKGADITGKVLSGAVDPRSPEGVDQVAGLATDLVLDGGKAKVNPNEVALGSGRISGPSPHSALLTKLREVYGKQQTDRPFPTAMREPTTTMIPEKNINIEDLQGKVAVPWQGDRTRAGEVTLGLNGKPFQEPVRHYGGPGFARAEAAQGPDRAAWASTPTATTTLHNRMQRVADETGLDPVGAYVPGSPKSSDFSLQGWNMLDQMIKQGDPSMKDLQKLYEGLQMGDQGLMPWALSQKGTPRSTAFKKFDTVNRARDLGVVPADVRMLLADPALLKAPQGEVGHMFALPDGRLIRDPVIKHPDYGSQIGGTYKGRFEPGSEVPREVFFADAYKNNSALGKMDPQAVEQTFKTQLPYQIIDQETVDRVRSFQELKRRRG